MPTVPPVADGSTAASNDPILTLLRHDAWATRRVLALCAAFTRDQFHQPFPIGLGSLHANLTHIVGAMRRWADRIAARPLRNSLDKPPEARDRSPLLLTELLDEAARDLQHLAAAAAADGSLHAPVDFVFHAPGGQETLRLPRQNALLHVATHGQHHRTQCLNMLRHLGHELDSGDYDLVEWSASHAGRA